MKSTRPKSADIIPLAQEATQTRETDNLFRKTGYARSSPNALKHGILSRYTVLPHEDGAEYQVLLAALMEEHNPQGATEMHLVEELAGIIWRKRRVRMAEGSVVNQGLRSTLCDLTGTYSKTVSAAVPFERALNRVSVDYQELMSLRPEKLCQWQKEARRDLKATEQAVTILRRGGAEAYNKALEALLPDNRDWWEECLEKGEYQANVEGLDAFIRNHLLPVCYAILKKAEHHEEIKRQALGESLQVLPLESLARYETHLDRKIERTLAMPLS